MRRFISVLVSLVLCLSVLPAAQADSPASWAEKEVNEAIADGLVPASLQSGYANKITREEFCLLMVTLIEAASGRSIDRTLDLVNVNRTDSFTDTKSDYVQAACALGIVAGKGGGIFDPDGSITRQEAALMLTRTARFLSLETGTSVSFKDIFTAASWARDGIAFVSGLRDTIGGTAVMGGTGGGNFSPKDTYTRQQAMLTAVRLYHAAAALSPEKAVTAKGSMLLVSYDDQLIRKDTGVLSWPLSDVPSGQYAAFGFKVRNHGDTTLTLKNAYATIDGGEKLRWVDYDLAAGATATYHVFNEAMDACSPGTHYVDFYVNGTLLTTGIFTLQRRWETSMNIPSLSDQISYETDIRSPYIVFRPKFEGETAFSEYALDLRADHHPLGTYLCGCNFDLTLDSLSDKYASVYREYRGVAGYAGLQVIYDGTGVAIFSLWDTFCEDSAGNVTTLPVKQVYPPLEGEAKRFGGEGTGVQCLVPFHWEPGHPYRLLVQLSNNAEDGHVHAALWIKDLESGDWDRISEYDTGLTSTYITTPCMFLENYLTDYAGRIRTAAFSNIRGRGRTSGDWVTAYACNLAQEYPEWTGSFNYGSDEGEFWAITTGIPGRVEKPEQNITLYVKKAATGQPY